MKSMVGPAGKAGRELRSRWTRMAIPLALAAIAGAAHAEHDAMIFADPNGPSFVITQSVVASGGITQSASPCFDLAGTIGQPVTGRTESDVYALDAGFWRVPASTDSIFRNSFETCQP